MMNILALLQCIQPYLSTTDVRRLSRIVQAMLSMTGRVTMLGLSRWAGKGCKYRTVQRFFNITIPWPEVFRKFFEQHLYRPAGEYFLVGDESVVTKSGKETHGLDYFFSGLLSKTVKGIAIFSLSLVSVEERRSYPLQVEQVVRTEAEKAAAKARKKKKSAKKGQTTPKKPGRPKGSKNRDKTQIELTAELKRIQKMVKNQLAALQNLVTVRYLALDGHFGNNHALQMVRQCGLQLISKLRHDAALHFIYDGKQKRKGRRKKYGQKINYRHILEKYLVEQSTQRNIQTRIYQAVMLHQDFAQALNVVIITKTNLKSGAFANVNLFSSDLELPYDKIIDFYRLRFQIEIVCTQMTKARVFTIGAGWDDIADFNFFVVYDHSINKQFCQLPALVKIQIIQGWLDTLAKLLDVVCQGQGLNLLLGLVFQLSQLLLETVLRSSQFLALSLEFVSPDDFSQIHFQKTFLLTFQASQGLTDGIAFRLQGLRQPFSGLSAFQFVGNQARVGYNAAEILPDKFIKRLGGHITSCATLALSGSMNISSPPAFVIVVFSLGTAGRRQTTLSATDQTPEKVFVALIIATGHILIFLQASLCSIKYFLIDDGWNRDCNPLLRRGRLDAFTPSHRQQGRFAPSCGDWPGASAVGRSCIRRRLQNAPNTRWVPAHPASRCGNLLFSQLFGNPVQRDRRFWVSIPGKDLLNHIGFDGVNTHPAGVTGSLGVQDVSIRSSRPRQQGSGSKFGLPSTPHSFGNQVALVLGHRPTDLQQELIMGIIILHRAFQKLDVTTQVVQFFNQQNLMNIFASQAIRRSYQDQFQGSHAGRISQPIQTWTIELGTGITIIAIYMLLCQLPLGLLRNRFSQTLDLLFNALTLHLAVGRYSGVEGDLHGLSPDWVILWAVDPWFVPSSSAAETGRYSPSDAVHRNTLRLCDELAILFSCLLLNIICHLGEAYPKFLFPQSQRTAPPRQLQLAPSCQAEFVICDQTIEFNFRDAKQYWGLEDFMNVKAVPLTNALNLSLFMVNLSQVLLRDLRQTLPESSILDLKAYFRAAKYFEETIKMLPQKPEPILLEQIFGQVASLGCIHAVNVQVPSP